MFGERSDRSCLRSKPRVENESSVHQVYWAHFNNCPSTFFISLQGTLCEENVAIILSSHWCLWISLRLKLADVCPLWAIGKTWASTNFLQVVWSDASWPAERIRRGPKRCRDRSDAQRAPLPNVRTCKAGCNGQAIPRCPLESFERSGDSRESFHVENEKEREVGENQPTNLSLIRLRPPRSSSCAVSASQAPARSTMLKQSW